MTDLNAVLKFSLGVDRLSFENYIAEKPFTDRFVQQSHSELTISISCLESTINIFIPEKQIVLKPYKARRIQT